MAFMLLPVIAHATQLTALDVTNGRTQVSPHVEFIEDPNLGLDLLSVVQQPASRWRKNHDNQVNFGYTDSAYWLRYRLINPDDYKAFRLIEFSYSVLDYLDVYLQRTDGTTVHHAMGDKLPFHQRPLISRNFLVPIELDAQEMITVYVRVKTSSSTQVPMTIWDPQEYYPVSQSRTIFHGIYFGITLVMVLYSLFVYRAVQESVYLYYVAFIISLPMFIASINGFSFQYLWPYATTWNDRAMVFALGGTVASGITFAMKFLSVSRVDDKWTYRYLSSLVAIALGLMLISIFVDYAVLIRPTIILSIIFCSSLLILAGARVLSGDRSARYFILAWISMLSGGIVLSLNKFTILPQNIFTENATQIGSALEIILLSIALADRLNREKLKTFAAQQESLEKEREARASQEQMLKVQREANTLLEQRVEERTRELADLNKQLLELSATDALTGLKNRRHFDEVFQQYYTAAYRHQQPLAMLLLDIDHFKDFNDNHGHAVGDDCLVMIAETIQSQLSRPQDMVARFGGEEFVLLLPDTDNQGACVVAERIRQQVVVTPFRLAEEVLHVTVSIGVSSIIPSRVQKQKSLFELTDQALYKAKESGRNQIQALIENTP
ncbi:diguanylate cyclase [Aestuariirhabdus sp. Z084]|uniref:sensor domain-containing diguanylate cyclase n=1 Tax=Aestuariirhabdus haliotis TaxID=2918751 RepID=UPI00201B40A7|nr:diguanylate cyclase [Aestuariirhabdus haliotis]MCL6416582.1 diguanylate cyclase [Aestuariirhabdus haliotis]MCL6420551.1 diguanylate cyclase [Aestuariirhabdus haliotis]